MLKLIYLLKIFKEIVIHLNIIIQFNFNMGYMGHVLKELWKPISFELITCLIVSIRHTIRLTELNKITT